MALKPSVGKKKSVSSYANVRSALGKSSSGESYKTSSGATVVVESGTSYSNVQKELDKYQAPTEQGVSSANSNSSSVSDVARDVFSGRLSAQDLAGGKRLSPSGVGVSGGFAQKLAREGSQPMSIRGDVGYQVSVPNRERKRVSVDEQVKKDVEFVGAKKTGKTTEERLKNAFEATGVPRLYRGGKYLLSSKEDRVQSDIFGGFYSDNPSEVAKFKKEQEARGGATELLLLGGGFMTGASVGLSSARAKVASKSVTKVVSSESGKVASESVISGKGLVERRILGFKILPDKKVSFSGRGAQLSKDTGRLGGVSKEPIFGLTGEAKINVKSGRKDLVVSVSSTGGGVGELSQRKSGIVVSKVGSSKSVGSGSLVETIVTKQSGDDVYGGVISKRGVEVFGGKRILESKGVSDRSGLKSVYVDEATGLDYAGGGSFVGKKLVVSEVKSSEPFTLSVFEGGSLGQSQVPFSASVTQKGAINLLKQEKKGSTKLGGVDIFKSSDDSFVIQQGKQRGVLVSDLNLDKSVGKGLELAFESKVKVPSLGVGVVKSKSVKSEGDGNSGLVLKDKGSSKGSDVVVSEYSLSQPLMNGKTDRVNNLSGSVLVGSKSNVFVGSRLRSNVSSDVANRSGSVVKSGLVSKSVVGVEALSKSSSVLKSGSESKVAQKSSLRELQALSQGYKSGLSLSPFKVVNVPFVPKIPSGDFDLKFGNKSFGVEVRRQGEFRSVGKGLNFEDAFRKGSKVVSGSSARTFRITQGKKVVDNLNVSGKFYGKKGGLVIEKVGYAINTGGELKEISFKGVESSRKKRKDRSVF